jgi:hypothetical protein
LGGLFFGHVFLSAVLGGALWILLFTLKINLYQKAKDNVLHARGDKKHDKK